MNGKIPGKAYHGGTSRRIQEIRGSPVLDFSASLNPWPPHLHPDLSWDHLTRYPDDSYAALREVIARRFGRSPEEVAIGNGSIELIRVFCQVTLRPGDVAEITSPTFGEYELSALLAGARVGGAGKSPRVKFLCNPNNPTGALRNRENLASVLDRCRERGTVLFLDEAFIELSDDPSSSLSGLRDPNLFVLRSLTKCFAVPGIRFGYGFGDPDLVARMEVARPPWSVNAFAEQVALEAFRQFDGLERSREEIMREREWLCTRLQEFPVSITPSQANFLLLTFRTDVSPLCRDLLDQGILVRDCHSFGLPCSIRIAVRTREENNQCIEALRACLR
jgi:threonine-phosphate decarboxylase